MGFWRYALMRNGVFLFCAIVLSSCLTATELESQFAPSDNPQTVGQPSENEPAALLGAKQHPDIVANYGGAYTDRKALDLVARIVGVLTTVSENPIQSYRVTILDSQTVNAFALPGGYLYVTRGLLSLANDEAELAAVISHEMAHVIANHGIERQEQQEVARIAGQVVSEVLSGNLSGRGLLARNKLRLAAFSRRQELQADEIGIRMLAQAGYDPYAAVRFLTSLQRYTNFNDQDGRSPRRISFLSSHPSTPKRLEFARKIADQYANLSKGERRRTSYMAGIDGLLFGDNADHGYVRGQRFLHPNLGIQFAVPDTFTLDNADDAVLANGPGDISMQFDAVDRQSGVDLDRYIRSGWARGLDPSSIQKRVINGLPAIRAQAKAGSWIFDVTVIEFGDFYYRFLTAAPDGSPNLDQIARVMTDSFRQLTDAERNAIKPLRIRVYEVGAQDSISSVAQKMQGTTQKIELFHVLNALASGTTLRVGDLVKIVAE